MWKRLAIGSFSIWIMTMGFITYKIQYGNAVQVDKRIEVTLKPVERELVLEEMRTLLSGLKGIIKGLSNDDFEVVKISASGNGMAMAQDINPALISKLPMLFKKMGMGVHNSFDEIANELPGLNTKQVLTKVDKIMNSCIACHNTYKIVEERD